MKKLSCAQKKALRWLGKGWSAQPSHGTVWTVNGGAARQGINITLATLRVLRERGLAQVDDSGCWVSTNEGKEAARDLKL